MIFGEGSERKKTGAAAAQRRTVAARQSLTLKWPVLHEGKGAARRFAHLGFSHRGLVEKPVRFTWEEFNRCLRRNSFATCIA